jgi:hypothetical protein
MPPQQGERLLDLVDHGLDFDAHASVPKAVGIRPGNMIDLSG